MTESSEKQPKIDDEDASLAKPRFRWLAILAALAVLVGVVMFLLEAEDTVDVEQTDDAPQVQMVSVLNVSSQPRNAVVQAFAEVRPRWSAELRSAVSGRVVAVQNLALAGEQIEHGAELFRIDPTQYETAVAEAGFSLEQARFELVKAQNKTNLAKAQFERANESPPTELAIHLPELRIAELAVSTNEARLAAAEKQLEETSVKAPFSGFVTERFISLGQTVSVGDSLVKLIDDSSFTLVVELDRDEWQLIDQPIAGQSAQLFSQSNEMIGTARVRRGGGFLDEDTRQFKVFLDLSSGEHTAPLSGDFLRVQFDGRRVENALTIPETAITREGYVWLVSEENKLTRHQPNVLFRDEDWISISVPEGSDTWKVALTPLASFLPGQRVQPVMSER